MGDEIKEISCNIRKIIKSNREDDFNRVIYDCDSLEKLLDYITNLQQCVSTMKERLDELEYAENYHREKMNDYKSRCEKAIEYNNQLIKDTKDFYRPTADIIYSGDSLIEIATNNINILQNGSDSQ